MGAHFYDEFEVMGTVVTFDAYLSDDASDERVEAAYDAACKELLRIDKTFSTYKEESEVSRFRAGALRISDLSGDVRNVLAECSLARVLTDGWFDPWALPGGVDPTGYVKGWAGARALEAFVIEGMSGALVNAAGDIAMWGEPAPGAKFRIGVTDPLNGQTLLGVVEASGAVATSGLSERGDHLFNPTTQRWESAGVSATIVGPDLGLADALATAVCIGGTDALALVENMAEYEGLFVSRTGDLVSTAGLVFSRLG